MKKLGVIGGLGPMATAYFLDLIIKMTKASCDQEHLDMIVYNCPSIPDRTSYILDKTKQNPLYRMTEIGAKLQAEEVDYIAMPCITAHYFYNDLQRRIQTPMINMVRETALYLSRRNIRKVGIMATDGTIEAGLLQMSLEEQGMEVVIPSEERQRDIMYLIYNQVKANKKPDMELFDEIKNELQENGADVIVLGCTELSLLKRDEEIGEGFVDAMEVLAMKSIEFCGLPIKQEYRELITT